MENINKKNLPNNKLQKYEKINSVILQKIDFNNNVTPLKIRRSPQERNDWINRNLELRIKDFDLTSTQERTQEQKPLKLKEELMESLSVNSQNSLFLMHKEISQENQRLLDSLLSQQKPIEIWLQEMRKKVDYKNKVKPTIYHQVENAMKIQTNRVTKNLIRKIFQLNLSYILQMVRKADKNRAKKSNNEIIVENTLTEKEKISLEKDSKKFVKKNIKSLYTIQEAVDSKRISDSQKGEKSKKTSFYETRKVDALAKKIAKNEIKEINKTKKEDFFNVEEDIWEIEKKKVTKAPEQKILVNNTKALPETGESYNPTNIDYNQKLQEIVGVKNIDENQELKRERFDQERWERKKQRISKQVYKDWLSKLSPLERAIHLKQVKQKKLIQKNQQENEIEKTMTQLQQELKTKENLIDLKKKKRELRRLMIQQGKLSLKKIYKSKKRIPDDFDKKILLPNELPEKITELHGSIEDQLRRNYMNIFRKGLVEYTEGNKINKTQRMKIKIKRKNPKIQKVKEQEVEFKFK